MQPLEGSKLDETKRGVTCRVVHDKLRLDGVLVERTFDWYAQSRSGDVWYFGERTAELGPHGKVLTTDGSWLAGRNAARAGIYITGAPRDGQSRPQELFPGHAEDHFQAGRARPAGWCPSGTWARDERCSAIRLR